MDGTDFVINEHRVPMGLSTDEEDCPKQLISMGAYVIIMPDKKWINTMDLTEYGNIEAKFTTTSDVTFQLCDKDGGGYANTSISATEPEDPENMDYWIDTSSTPHTLKQYASTTDMWVNIATTYVKIASPGIGAAFQQYDGVTISGITNEQMEAAQKIIALALSVRQAETLCKNMNKEKPEKKEESEIKVDFSTFGTSKNFLKNKKPFVDEWVLVKK